MAISVSSADLASTIRTFPWPVLDAGNRAFANGTYTVDIEDQERGRSFVLSHHVFGAPLIERWVKEGKVRFACAVSAPVSAFRQLHVSSDPSHLVQWDPDDLGSHPLFTPMIVAAVKMRHVIESQRDGVNPLWDGVAVNLPKAARLAVGPTFALRSGLLGLLDFRLDGDLKPGQFRVEASHEGGFRFNVYLAADLHAFLAAQRREAVGWNVMTHIVSTAFGQLKRDFGDDDGEEGWESYPNLISLAEELDRKGLPIWDDETFEPEVAATTLYPHKIVASVVDD